jgi:glycosyltransferase involved in cell wall biosynthesis
MTNSVCMATYNGERYLARQLESILGQLSEHDEVVIVDDCSTDATIAIISGLSDKRVKVWTNEYNRREVYSFGRAIQFARGDVIFLADQDDIWQPSRVALMESRLQKSGAFLVTSNFDWVDETEQPLRINIDGVRARDSRRHLKNLVDIFLGRTNYFGCAMAFRRELLPLITPIPAYVESHDLWIALAANLIGSNLHIEEKTLRKRRHGGNVTMRTYTDWRDGRPVSTRSLYRKLKSRAIFAQSVIEVQRRRRGWHRSIWPGS